jgi:uncharacterized protein YfcZ (UPF0381/DUF406 family)
MALVKKKTPTGATKWEVRIRLDGRDSKEIRRRFDRRRDAEDFLDEFKSQAREQDRTGFAPGVMEQRKFAEEAEYWLKASEFKFSSSHLKRVRGVLNEILPKYGKYSISKMTPSLLVNFQNQQLKVGKTPSTVNRKTEVITAILNNSFKHRRIPYNPSAGFTKLKSKSAEWDSGRSTRRLIFFVV